LASITIRDIDETVTSRLRMLAATHGCSMEDEARNILSTALGGEPLRTADLATSIRKRFAKFGGVDLPLVPREPMRAAPNFGE